jgi:hypothetical protein
MKKIIITLGIILLAGNARGQGIPVMDVDHMVLNEMGWETELFQILEQVTQLEIQNKHLKDSYELYSKLKEEVKNARIIKAMMDKQAGLIVGAARALTMNSNQIGDMEIYQAYRLNVLAILERNEVNTKALKDYITNAMFKMNDSERIAAVERIGEKTDELHSLLDTEMRKFSSINSKLLFLRIALN